MAEDKTLLYVGLIGLGAYALYTIRKPLEQTAEGFGVASYGLGSGISEAAQATGDVFRDVQGVTGSLRKNTGVVFDETAETFKGITDLAQESLSIPTTAAGGVKHFVSEGFENVENVSRQIRKTASNTAKKASGSVSHTIKEAKEDITNISKKLRNTASSAVSEASKTISHTISEAKEDAGNISKKLRNTASSVVSKAVSSAKSFISSIGKKLRRK